MKGPPPEYTAHASLVMTERGIERRWVERVLESPSETRKDALDPDLSHAVGLVPEFGGRVLRVVYNHKVNPPRVVTAFFDRAMKGRV